MLLMAMLSLCATSCSKDEEDSTVSLVGKKFVSKGETYTFIIWGTPYTYTPYDMYRFTSDHSYEYTSRENSVNGKILSTEYGTYVLDYPKITFKESSSENSRSGTFVDHSTIRIGLYDYVEIMGTVF